MKHYNLAICPARPPCPPGEPVPAVTSRRSHTGIDESPTRSPAVLPRLACPVEGCPRMFFYRTQRLRHLPAHSSYRPFGCPHPGCGKTFKQQKDVKYHLAIHSNDRPYACTLEGCRQRFRHAASLRVHDRMHRGEKPYACPFADCPARFATHGHRNAHTSRFHTGKKTHPCPLPGCRKWFATPDKSRTHYRQVHQRRLSGQLATSENPPLTTAGKKQQPQHRVLARGQTAAQPVSGSASAAAQEASKNARTDLYAPERPFACLFEGCGKRFWRKHHLQTHGGSHSGTRPYACPREDCGKLFRRVHHLQKHLASHRVHKTPYMNDSLIPPFAMPEWMPVAVPDSLAAEASLVIIRPQPTRPLAGSLQKSLPPWQWVLQPTAPGTPPWPPAGQGLVLVAARPVFIAELAPVAEGEVPPAAYRVRLADQPASRQCPHAAASRRRQRARQPPRPSRTDRQVHL